MTRFNQPKVNYEASDVWAASCAAYRINGAYLKTTLGTDAKQTNRQIMLELLAEPNSITQEDREMGEKVRTYFKGYTFKILKGIKLSDFDSTAMALANRDAISSNYDIAVICSLPSTHERSVNRDKLNNRIQFAQGGYVGKVGDKITITSLEIVKVNWSQQFNVYYVTGINQEDQAVFFPLRSPPSSGDVVNIKGTVRAYRDNITQLTRVKVI